jgi:hypothetical protein
MPAERLTLLDGSSVTILRASGLGLICATPAGERQVYSWEARSPAEYRAIWDRLGGSFSGLAWEDGTPAEDEPPVF